MSRSPYENLFQALLRVDKRTVFYYTHIANLESIASKGFLSRDEVARQEISHENYSMGSVQNRRREQGLHRFVNFYFARENPSTKKIEYERPDYFRQLIFCEVSILSMLTDPTIDEVKFTDGNAASPQTNHLQRIEDIARIDWGLINSDSWFAAGDDEQTYRSKKRKRCAELLIANKVPFRHTQRYELTPQASEQTAEIAREIFQRHR